ARARARSRRSVAGRDSAFESLRRGQPEIPAARAAFSTEPKRDTTADGSFGTSSEAKALGSGARRAEDAGRVSRRSRWAQSNLFGIELHGLERLVPAPQIQDHSCAEFWRNLRGDERPVQARALLDHLDDSRPCPLGS